MQRTILAQMWPAGQKELLTLAIHDKRVIRSQVSELTEKEFSKCYLNSLCVNIEIPDSNSGCS
jgi:hypothetical protein